MLATTQPATPAKHGTTDANSIPTAAIELTESQEEPLMPEATNPNKQRCDLCSSIEWTDATWSGGMLICDECMPAVRAAEEAAQPPTAREQMLLADWIHPAKGASHG
jgi:hypothetical protein